MHITNSLNLRNPIVAREYVAYQRRNNIPLWQPLEGPWLAQFQLEFFEQYEQFQQEHSGLHGTGGPLLLYANSQEIKAAYGQYISKKVALADVDQRDFERQFAAGKVAEYHAALALCKAVS